ncbi:hypothetical protein [Amycolatopsis pittospori]|uniref:hypothetical protein n=1 Tax=Amycolatopsis pittospori TaxID=2749434 RepID=UPI0015F020E6|nr:hypothetical protein [Amycolatopsis pittospori]
MGQGINAYLPAIQRFADTVASQASHPQKIERDLSDGCGGMDECRQLATADRDSTTSLQNFLTAAEKGVWGYISIARSSLNAYQNASEAAVWELTKRSRQGESYVPVEGMSPSALGPSPLAPPTVATSPWPGLWPNVTPR